MQVVGEAVVHVLSLIGRNIRRNNEEEVGKQEKYGDWERGTEGRSPLLRIAIRGEGFEVESDERDRNEDVDNSQWVGYDAGNRLVGVQEERGRIVGTREHT